jgi:hypothetical protein
MITKEEFTSAKSGATYKEVETVMERINRQLELGSMVTEIKSSAIRTPWYIFIPSLQRKLNAYGWKLEVTEKWVNEGGNEHDRTTVLYKVLTVS